MAEVEFISHSGIYNHDMVETERFYGDFLGAPHTRMSGARTCVVPGGYQLLFFLPEARMPTPDEGTNRGIAGIRHGFAVSRERFEEIVEEAQEHAVPFEGPVTHPERGPLGQSIYFKDPAGNFLEVCWRRDADQPYHRVVAVDAD